MNDQLPFVSHQMALGMKQRARVLRKTLRCSHARALNMLAEELGYASWQELTRLNPVSRSAKKEL